MKFKTESFPRLNKEWNDSMLAPKVKAIVIDAAQYAENKWNWEFVITSIYRTLAEDAALGASGIHSAWRAVDVRTKDRDSIEVGDVSRYINAKYVYDEDRPKMKVCFDEPHGNGVHAHYQVHQNTKLRS